LEKREIKGENKIYKRRPLPTGLEPLSNAYNIYVQLVILNAPPTRKASQESMYVPPYAHHAWSCSKATRLERRNKANGGWELRKMSSWPFP
jgi:hypothetical protein